MISQTEYIKRLRAEWREAENEADRAQDSIAAWNPRVIKMCEDRAMKCRLRLAAAGVEALGRGPALRMQRKLRLPGEGERRQRRILIAIVTAVAVSIALAAYLWWHAGQSAPRAVDARRVVVRWDTNLGGNHADE